MSDVTLPTAMPANLRLFIGLMAPDPVRDTIAAWRSGWQWPRGAALSASAHWHLTLHFLGDTPAGDVPRLIDLLGQISFGAFELRLGRPEFWPRGLVVIRPEASAALDPLHQLHARVQAALREWTGGAPAGDAAPLPWKPHLTLARRAKGAVPPPHAPALDLAWQVDAFSLVWSRLPPAVPVARYESLARFEARAG